LSPELTARAASTELLPDSAALEAARPEARGKFLFAGTRQIILRGVTYGTFRPGPDGCDYPAPERVAQDFVLMRAHGFNALRTYTVPPRWLLDAAQRHGLRVLVGLPWEQHVAFLAGRARRRSIEQRVRDGVRACAGHPAVLAFAIGNEIPAPIVRWHGRRRIEDFLERLYEAAKAEDPGALVTYVNYPSTEHLRLPFLDFTAFNVYLEARDRLEAYLARLHNLAGDRPLVMAEIGLDSRRNGPDQQVAVLDWQVRAALGAGCAGAFLFAWTDEWHRGGHDIEDWDFGLTTRDRRPKPALAAASAAFSEAPFPPGARWPKVSVVVCTHNGARTIRDTLRGLQQVEYPDFEVIVIDDGSRDATAAIVKEFPARLIQTENRGLSAARNTGWREAAGEIVVYLDDDAWPDPHWLQWLVSTFQTGDHMAAGGPNLAPPDAGDVAECVANAPGGPVHVLLSDTVAEHVPGCNMAFRRSALEALGGFDPQFRAAGDDVDVCWRVQQRGWTIGFSPAALVWHRRRDTLRGYWRQQRGYGKAEALLERKWPEKYNAVGHIQWAGRLYGRGLTRLLGRVRRVYHGPWGAAPFQGLHEAAPGLWSVLPTMPEWYLVILALGGLSWLALLWPKLVWALPFLALAAGATLAQAVLSAADATFPRGKRSPLRMFKLRALTTLLHLLQPVARLWGRARHGLTALRVRGPRSLALPFPRASTIWTETWRSPEQALLHLTHSLRSDGAVLLSGGAYDRWELEVRGGTLGAARLFMTVEEHGGGKQLFRFRRWPRFSWEGVAAILVFADLTLGAALDQYWLAYDILAVVTLGLLGRMIYESGCAMAALQRALQRGFDNPP
jgi:GT2 family glycosyltransferase